MARFLTGWTSFAQPPSPPTPPPGLHAPPCLGANAQYAHGNHYKETLRTLENEEGGRGGERQGGATLDRSPRTEKNILVSSNDICTGYFEEDDKRPHLDETQHEEPT